MKWIGLTGGIATGKSTVAKILRDLGLPVVDADNLSREAVRPHSPGLTKLIELFGAEIIDANGHLNRKQLAEIIFNDKDKRIQVEAILHPIIQELRARERRDLEQMNEELAFYDVPLLFEKKLESEFDATILVYATEEEQRKRIKERDHLTDEEIDIRLKSQLPIDLKLKKAKYIIFNNESLSNLKQNVESIISEIRNEI